MTVKEDLLIKLNEAFANSDTEYILTQVTDDITWTVQGDFTLHGKEDFERELKKMESPEPYKLDVKRIITHGKSAAVEGIMSTLNGEGKSYAFCDIYQFNGFKNPKIKAMTSYVIELK